MAGYNFVSPGAAAGNAIQQFLAQREAQQRQQMLDAAKAQADQAAAARQQQQLMIQAEQLNMARAQEARLQEAQGFTMAQAARGSYAPGQVVAEPDVERIGRFFPGEVRAETTLPARTLDVPTTPVTGGGPTVPGILMPPTPTGRTTYLGTPAQRQTEGQRQQQAQRLTALLADPTIPEPVKQLVRAQQAAGDLNLPYQAFQGPETKPVVRASADKRGLEIFQQGQWMPVTGEIPKDAVMLQEPQPSGEGRPYYMPLQTAQGILSYDARTGQIVGRVADLKPGETAQRELAVGQTVMSLIDTILSTMTPEKLGPAIGRYKSVQEAVTGGDPAFSALRAQVSQLQNVVINLRTGAAMSEPEAARIMAELPDENLPPATFLARLKNAQSYYKEWRRNRATIAYGRTTVGDVGAMVGGPGRGAPGGGVPGGGVTAPAGAPGDPLGIR